MAGKYAAANAGGLLHGAFSGKTLITGAVALIVTAGFAFLDWHKLLVEKRLAFNFSIWK